MLALNLCPNNDEATNITVFHCSKISKTLDDHTFIEVGILDPPSFLSARNNKQAMNVTEKPLRKHIIYISIKM